MDPLHHLPKYTLARCHIQSHLFSPPTTQEERRKYQSMSSSALQRFQIGQKPCLSQYSPGYFRQLRCESAKSADGRWALHLSESQPHWLPSHPPPGWMRVTALRHWTFVEWGTAEWWDWGAACLRQTTSEHGEPAPGWMSHRMIRRSWTRLCRSQALLVASAETREETRHSEALIDTTIQTDHEETKWLKLHYQCLQTVRRDYRLWIMSLIKAYPENKNKERFVLMWTSWMQWFTNCGGGLKG